VDARVSVEGTVYEVNPDLAGETVVLWWGLFDNELYVEHGEERYGPYHGYFCPTPRKGKNKGLLISEDVPSQ
jgi:hypothetical protein